MRLLLGPAEARPTVGAEARPTVDAEARPTVDAVVVPITERTTRIPATDGHCLQ